MNKKAAIILCGSGYLDGSEIHEATLCLLHLDLNKASASCYAPSRVQFDTINHLTQEPSDIKRDSLIESARISRTKIKPLSKLDAKNYDLLLIPGGFGVAKTLCDFASKGKECTVDKEVERIILSFLEAKKPIIATCISPALIAKVLENNNLSAQMTLGPEKSFGETLSSMGMQAKLQKATEFTYDSPLNIYTTPAYMDDNASIKDLNIGIGNAIKQALLF